MDSQNPMRAIRIAKVTLNIGLGSKPEELPKAKKILEQITGRKAVIILSRKRSTFNVPKGKQIGVKVTLRKQHAIDTLKRLLVSKDNRLSPDSFDSTGNFSFGIDEYINIPGIKYDPDIGIMGLDVCITLERPGYRIKRKSMKPKPVGKRHVITKQEAMDFAKGFLGAAIEK